MKQLHSQRGPRGLLLILAACLGLGGSLFAQAEHDHDHDHESRSFSYTQEMLDLAGSLPVQESGRIKPLSTVAGFRLLKMNGKRSLKVEGLAPEDKLDAMGWLLDLMLFPGQAGHYACFKVDDWDLVTSIGVGAKMKRRAWFSYEELAQGREALRAKAVKIYEKEQARIKLGREDRQVMGLWRNLTDYESLSMTLSFASADLSLDSCESMRALWPEGGTGAAQVVAKAPELMALFDSLRNKDEAAVRDQEQLVRLADQLERLIQMVSGGLGLFPPAQDAESAEWLDAGAVMALAVDGDPAAASLLDSLTKLQEVEQSKQDAKAFTAALQAANGSLAARAEARGEYSKVSMERSFYAVDYFYKSLLLFGLAFLMCAISWMVKPGKFLLMGIWGPAILAELFLVAGIVMRCILRSRPPVSTLYETILFITASAVLVGMIAEKLNPKRMALSVVVVLGLMGMFLAGKYELKEAATAGDTMPSLVAVLDTNFWLATHVTCITLGYAAGLLASALAHVWLVMWAFGKKRTNPKAMRDLLRTLYGVLCFALLFSVVGTILGGVWANESWGRFWGWDPKENGALLICLIQIAILHARLTGMIKHLGLVLSTIFGGMVVAFSWWGVNLLGVGLHSYGFTDGVAGALNSFYVMEGGIILLAGVAHFLGRSSTGGAAAGA
ncbi:MAG: ABC-type transport system involved in cytochrome c biogenesis permease subunit [Planctomycetota bacterium]|jgi:ABC-type transport system involved in cytochrome c biogenesis permease subunit